MTIRHCAGPLLALSLTAIAEPRGAAAGESERVLAREVTARAERLWAE